MIRTSGTWRRRQLRIDPRQCALDRRLQAHLGDQDPPQNAMKRAVHASDERSKLRPVEKAALPIDSRVRAATRTALVILLVVLALWVASDFLSALAWAAIIAITTWPIHTGFAGAHCCSGWSATSDRGIRRRSAAVQANPVPVSPRPKLGDPSRKTLAPLRTLVHGQYDRDH